VPVAAGTAAPNGPQLHAFPALSKSF
jgi:hypothetical protein